MPSLSSLVKIRSTSRFDNTFGISQPSKAFPSSSLRNSVSTAAVDSSCEAAAEEILMTVSGTMIAGVLTGVAMVGTGEQSALAEEVSEEAGAEAEGGREDRTDDGVPTEEPEGEDRSADEAEMESTEAEEDEAEEDEDDGGARS